MNHLYKIFYVLFVCTTLLSQNLSEEIEAVLTDSLFDVSQIAIKIYDLTADETLYSQNSSLLFRPASNMKLFSTSAALLYLSPDHKFQTKFYFDGEINDSTLNGHIYIRGGFDPLFKTTDLDTVTATLKKLAINKINGNLYADVSNIDSLYFGKGWMWDDNPSAYMPYLSSLCINRNSVEIFFEPGTIDSLAEVKIKPDIDFYSVKNELVTTNEDTSNIIIERDWLGNKNQIIINGDISYREGVDSASTNIVSPAEYFLSLLGTRLQENGVQPAGNYLLQKVNPNAVEFFVFERELIDVVNETNKESYNLGAEMLVRELSHRNFPGSASAEKGLKYIDSLIVLLGYSPKTFVIADGSGLSHYNLISAELVTDLLKYFYKEEPELYGYLYESLPVAGVDGTLEHRMRYTSAYNNVRAKTGTVSGVSSLSGYLTNSSNHLIAFSILIQNYSGSPRDARKIQDKICSILASSQ